MKESLYLIIKKVTMVLSAITILTFFIILFSSFGKQKTDSERHATAKQTYSGIKEESRIEYTAYERVTMEDSSMEAGTTRITQQGKPGEVRVTYKITYKDGVEVSRIPDRTEKIKDPISEIMNVGTAVVWHCVDVTSYDRNPYNDNKCTSSTGEVRYVSDSQAVQLSPAYSPGKSGHRYYNSK